MTPPATTMLPFLQKLEARSSFSAEEHQAILALPFIPRQVQSNQDFVYRGARVSHSCFVLEGFVGTFGENRYGGRQITSVFGSGDMIDLQTVVLPEAMSALQALTATTILQVPHSSLRQVAHRFPNVAEAFWRDCVIDAAIVSEWVVNVGRRDAQSRMAHVFCELACRSGRAIPGNSFSFPFPVTQAQFGDMLGLTPVHVNRTMKGLREDGLVEVRNRTATILDWKRLAEVGDFDPAYLQLGLSAGDRANGGKCTAGTQPLTE